LFVFFISAARFSLSFLHPFNPSSSFANSK
jgi:hypothetical protein